MAFSIQDYMADNKITTGTITQEVGDTPYKGGKLDLYTHKKVTTTK
jgi:hypothetical protein